MNYVNHHFDDPSIEVLSENPRLNLLQSRLKQGRLRAVRAALPLRVDIGVPLLIDTTVDKVVDKLSPWFKSWLESPKKRPLAVIGECPEGLDARTLIVIEDAEALLSLRERLSIRNREALRKKELQLRSATARTLGANETGEMAPQRGRRALFVGEASASFGALKTVLRDQNVDLVAALTHLTARDYLSEGAFSAILLEPTHTDDEAIRFLKRFCVNLDTLKVPLLLIEDPKRMVPVDPFLRNQARLIINKADSINFAADQIVALMNKPDEAVVPTPHSLSTIHDPETAVFSPTFLREHLANVLKDCDVRGHAVSLLYLTPRDHGYAISELAETVRANLRETDLAARLDEHTLCIVMPETIYRSGLNLAHRLEKLTNGRAEWRVIERRQTHSLDDLLQTEDDRRRNWARRKMVS
ncbi:MAG: hypothetical protein AAGJ84_04765 [Pseudomonadota bacterium]